MIDLKGQGFSGGSRCGGNKIQDFHKDISTLFKYVKPTLPLFLYGHSMGGLSVASYLANNPNLKISGMILSAPLLAMSERAKIDEVKRGLIKALASQFDELVINPLIPVNLISRDPRVMRDFLTNRKVVPFISLGLTRSMLEYIDDIPYNLGHFHYPYLIMIAEKEAIVSNSGAKLFHQKSASKDKELVEFKDCFHELHKEPNKDEILSKVL